MELSYDLHIHSCLSPCGDMDMTPNNIAGMAMIKELNIIALTDHNTARNAPALMKAAEQYGLIVLPGMELTTQEEVHVVCLFAEAEDALAFDRYVYERLLKIRNKVKVFGEQVIMNEMDEPVGEEEFLLINATSIPFDDVYDIVSSFNGIMIPAHLDKSTTSLISNLGQVPPGSRFTCAEVKNLNKLHELLKANPYLEHCRIISDSDAHYLEDINEPVHTLAFPNDHPTRREILDTLVSPPG
ncbi:MAG: PHP domain-containing protein [Lachnospiraceae bacterium]|nr:PHP domain-containing protein [Lachnospiraceae bacterium]